MTKSDPGANTRHTGLLDTPVHASFLVTSYNKVAYLPAVLTNVWHEAVAIGGEVILVDDGSTDGSVQVCETFVQAHPAVHYWRQENRGIYATVNDIAAKARGKWIRFCDSDDPLIAGSTRRLIEVAERLGAGVVYGRPIYYGPEPIAMDQFLERSGPDGLSNVHTDGLMYLIRGMNFTPSMTVYRRETLDYALPLPINLVSCQDLALLLPIVRHTALAWVDEPVCYNLKGASNQLSDRCHHLRRDYRCLAHPTGRRRPRYR